MTKPSILYDEDFVRWTAAQAALLRHAKTAGVNLPLDWDNLAEEIESLGQSNRRELQSRIRRILRHLLKLKASLAQEPRAGWWTSILDARAEIEALLEDNPSLRKEIEAMIARQIPVATKLAAGDLAEHGESADQIMARLAAGGLTAEEVLGDWFPNEAG